MSTSELTFSSGDIDKEVGDVFGNIRWWTCFRPEITFVIFFDLQQFELT